MKIAPIKILELNEKEKVVVNISSQLSKNRKMSMQKAVRAGINCFVETKTLSVTEMNESI